MGSSRPTDVHHPNGWAVTASAEQSVFTVVHDNKLSTVLEDVRLDLKSEGALHPLKKLDR